MMLIKNIEPEAQSFHLSLEKFYGGRGGSQNTYVKRRDTLDVMIDFPCLKACKYLFDCNILTLASSANKTDIISDSNYSKGFITIDYTSLDDNNKRIFQVEKGFICLDEAFEKRKIFNLEIFITEDTTAEDFSNKMLSLALYFQPQLIYYGCYSTEEFRNFVVEKGASAKTMDGSYFSNVLLERLNHGEILENLNGEIAFSNGKCISMDTYCQEFAQEFGYFYDEEEEIYWIDKELCEKAKALGKNLKHKR